MIENKDNYLDLFKKTGLDDHIHYQNFRNPWTSREEEIIDVFSPLMRIQVRKKNHQNPVFHEVYIYPDGRLITLPTLKAITDYLEQKQLVSNFGFNEETNTFKAEVNFEGLKYICQVVKVITQPQSDNGQNPEPRVK